MMDIKSILNNKIPEHIAIILDGNGRWAKKRFLPRMMGHRSGAKNLEKVTKYCSELGIKCLTVYAFSTENWNRPSEEVEYLMNYPVRYIKRKIDKLVNSNVKINFIGRKDRFPIQTLEAINEAEMKTQNNNGLKLNIAFDYGSKNEIITATKEIVKEVLENKISVDDIDEKLFENHLFTKGDPKLDLLIRTSGELRISNFMLWQLSYAELYFADCYWPDFDKDELLKAIESFQKRKRRFGGLDKEDVK